MDAPLHPSQLYESAAAFLIFAFLLWLAPRKSFHGQVVLTYVALYSTVRFALEFWRGDPDRGAWFGGVVSTSQLISVVLLVGAALILPRVKTTQTGYLLTRARSAALRAVRAGSVRRVPDG